MKPSSNSNRIELNKIPGFDILEKLPEEQMLGSYNEEFYSTLSQVKFMSLKPSSENERLLYHFEQNENASISTTVGQLIVRLMDKNYKIFKTNLHINFIYVDYL